jgi:hypothetical protein
MIDNFLGDEVCKLYRREAEGFYNRGDMSTSQSTRWNPDSNAHIAYDKINVKSAQLNGGDDYHLAPRLHEYIVSFIKNIVPTVNKVFPSAMLSPTMASNKLGKNILQILVFYHTQICRNNILYIYIAVCLGEGSRYDKHYDNSGGSDLRKLTAVLYLNPSWRPELGGYFRIFLVYYIFHNSCGRKKVLYLKFYLFIFSRIIALTRIH